MNSVADAASAVRPGADQEAEQNISSADPDPGADGAGVEQAAEEIGAQPEASGDVWTRLMQPLDGSIRENRIGELWNPQRGGLNRLVLVAEEVAGLGDGLPRFAHVPLGLLEAYVVHGQHLKKPSNEEENDESDELGSISMEEL